MTAPRQDIIDALESLRSEPTFTQGEEDFRFVSSLLEEASDLTWGKVHLLAESTERDPKGPFETAGVHPLYGDKVDPDFIDSPEEVDQRKLDFDAYINHSPSQQLLTHFGVKEERDLAVWFPFQALKDKGLVRPSKPRGVEIGDLVFWDETFYRTDSSHRDTYFGQTDKNFFTVAFCSRYQHNSIPRP